MKKLIIALSIACAGASGAFAEAFDRGEYEQWQTPWFNGIGVNPTASSLDPTNGSWTLPSSGYKIEEKKLVLDGSQDVSFTIGNAYAVDSNTIVEVTATAKFAPVLPTDLTIPTDAKVAFAVVKDGSDLSYRAWVVGQEKWQTLGDIGPAETEEEITVLIQLNNRSHYATFSVNGETSAAEIGIPNDVPNPTGFTITGCGTVASVDGEVQYNVAKIGDKGYATLEDAFDAANDGDTVSVVRETEEYVSLPTGKKITIADNGNVKGNINVPQGVTVEVKPTYEELTFSSQTGTKGESGRYLLNSFSLSGSGTVKVVLPQEMEPYKEVYGDVEYSGWGALFNVRTKNSILNSALESIQDLGGLNNNDTLRDYLTTNLQAYVAAQANKTDIAAGLTNVAKAVSEGGNGFALYEIFLLDIAPEAKVGIVNPPAGDTQANAIGISFPFPIRSEYSDTYKIRYNKNFGKGEEDWKEAEDGNIIPVPIQTGTYKICIKLTLAAK